MQAEWWRISSAGPRILPCGMKSCATTLKRFYFDTFAQNYFCGGRDEEERREEEEEEEVARHNFSEADTQVLRSRKRNF